MKKAPDLSPADYLIKILNARVYDVATESALETAKNLSQRIHNTVLLKREDQQIGFGAVVIEHGDGRAVRLLQNTGVIALEFGHADGIVRKHSVHSGRKVY